MLFPRSPGARPSLFAAALLVTCLCPAQAPAPSPRELSHSAILAQLRSPKLTVAEAMPLVEDLRYRPTKIRLSASSVLRALFQKQEKDYAAAERALESRLEALAARLQRERLAEGNDAKVAAARSAALAASRDKELSKESIHRDIDPQMEVLGALLLAPPQALLDADPDAATALAELRTRHADLVGYYRLYTGATAEMEGNEDVDKHFAKNPLLSGPGDDRAIDRLLERAAFHGLAMSDTDRKALAFNETLRGTVADEELAGTLALNRIRYQLGLSLLRVDVKLGDAARDHSTDMERLGFFAHESPVPGKETPGKRASNFGTSGAAENIANGHDTGPGAILGWWYSPGHHRNMLGNHRRTGLGRKGLLWTQMFGG